MFAIIEDATLTKLIIPGFTVMGGVIAALFRIITKSYEETKGKLEECHTQHDKANDQILGLTEKLGRLEGRQQGVESLAASVLLEIKKGQSNDG